MNIQEIVEAEERRAATLRIIESQRLQGVVMKWLLIFGALVCVLGLIDAGIGEYRLWHQEPLAIRFQVPIYEEHVHINSIYGDANYCCSTSGYVFNNILSHSDSPPDERFSFRHVAEVK